MSRLKPAIFFDRDGTLTVEKEYLSDPAGVEMIPGAIEALKMAYSLGFSLFVVTNQSGVARGMMTIDDVHNINNRIIEIVNKNEIKFDGIYFCPHHPDFTGPCECRKPQRGMIDQALKSHTLDLAHSFVIGDMKSDIELAANVGAQGILVTTGFGAGQVSLFDGIIKPVYIADDILAAVKWIGQHD